MRAKLLPIVLALFLTLFAQHTSAAESVLAVDIDADRMVLTLPMAGTTPFRLLFDTGGFNSLFERALARRGLATPDFLDSPFGSLLPAHAATSGRFSVARGPDAEWGANVGKFDGLVGMDWLRERVITLDYPGRRIVADDVAPLLSPHMIPLNFAPKDAPFARPCINMRVDGELLTWLFDTGASGELSAEAMRTMGLSGPHVRGISAVREDVALRWLARHPAWRVLERGETYFNAWLLEAPRVEIAGHSVGPVWFVVLHSPTYMDELGLPDGKRVVGVAGGPIFSRFRITLDFLRARASFDD